MVDQEIHPKSPPRDRLRFALILLALPIILFLLLSVVGLFHSYNVFCWNGIDVKHYPDGQVEMETSYRGGLRHGRQTRYYPDGQKMIECTFHQGKLQGLHRSWDAQGRLAEETEYDQGLMHGPSKQFDAEGNVASTDTYNQGVLERSEHYVRTPEGTRTVGADYLDGKPWSGTVVRYVSGQGYKAYSFDEGRLLTKQ